MKKPRPKLVRITDTPPPGWPTEAQWKEIEEHLATKTPVRIIRSDATPVEFVKYDLCQHFIRYFNAEKITQTEMAKRLKVPKSRVNEILHCHYQRYTIDKLFELYKRIKPNAKLKLVLARTDD